MKKERKIVIYETDKKVVAEDSITNKRAVARCCPDDEFNFKTGAKLALERLFDKLDEIKVGDSVKVVDRYKTYDKYWQWIELNVKIKGQRYEWDIFHLPENKDIGKVLYIAEHGNIDDMLAYVKLERTDRCYLMSIKGLEQC